MKRILDCLVLAIFVLGPAHLRADDASLANAYWPQWRGPHFTGASPDSETPATWSDSENIKWKVPLPGKGHSTPIVWGDKIFIQTAVAESKSGARQPYRFDVVCIDRATGRTLWQKTARSAAPHEGYHRQYGSFASGSPSTDGEHVWAFFGSRGLFCFDMDGNLKWEKDFGFKMRMRNAFGEGASPRLHENTLIMHFDDNSNDSFVVALDKRTGDELWRVQRDEISSWSTPIIHNEGGRAHAIIAATSFVTSYDLRTGDVIWKCAGLGSNVIPCPIISQGNVIVMSGHRGPAMFAIELGRTGDLTGTDAVQWTIKRGMSYSPSPVLLGDTLYMVDRRGTVSAIDTATGKPHYQQERLPRGYSFKASPTASKDKIYLATEQGDVVVLKPGSSFEVLATNSHDEFFVASPAIAGNELFLRGDKHLYCITAD